MFLCCLALAPVESDRESSRHSTVSAKIMLGCVSAEPGDSRMHEGGSSHQPQHHELPADPRLWNRQQVAQWLQGSSVRYQLGNTYPERFPMNGKALVIMTKEMFLYRVPEGGGILYEDIQLKLRKAMNEAFEQATALGLTAMNSVAITKS